MTPPRPTPVPPALIEVRGLACERGGRPLLQGLDLTLDAGELLWLRGANGSGKTTLMRTLLGLAPATGGTVHWAEGTPRLHVAHANALKDDLTAAESLVFLARLAGGAPTADAVRAALAALGVRSLADRPVRTLSQGQRRRVSLARLALADPAGCWLLDEPFDALDTDAVDRLSGLMRDHAGRGGAVVFTSHLPVDGLGPRLRTLDLAAWRPRGRA